MELARDGSRSGFIPGAVKLSHDADDVPDGADICAGEGGFSLLCFWGSRTLSSCFALSTVLRGRQTRLPKVSGWVLS